MRWRDNLLAVALTTSVAIAALYPALAQRAPESILPPGFGEPDPPPSNATAPKPQPSPPKPDGDALPDYALVPPPAPGDTITDIEDDAANVLGNAAAFVPEPMDLPVEARRSVDGVGLLTSEDGGLASNAFTSATGPYLAALANRMTAPIASRWLSITLRRALLSQTATPAGIGGVDWVATRAWLLVRMGEADAARSLVSRVDGDNYTQWMNTVALQAALATADPGALCGIADAAAQTNDERAWPLVRAMCAGLSGEGGTASALVDQARRRTRGIDKLLAEKVAGVGTNTRRAITIQWDGVDQLTAWRFGLATATGVSIPDRLMDTVGPQVRAWQARAPLLAPEARLAAADRAATLGVFSSAALVDLYGTVYDDTDPSDRGETIGATLRTAYVGDAAARRSALTKLWTDGANAPLQHYARLILSARAAAMIAPQSEGLSGDDAIAAMLSAGLDLQAARWAGSVTAGSRGWGLLAVGGARASVRADRASLGTFASQSGGGDDDRRTQFLFAGLAGLGRLPAGEIEGLAREYAVPVGRVSSWTRALDRAVQAGDPGSVALLCAVGMQSPLWANVPPENLYRIVASLRAVGLEPEARMIAAEALMRI